MNSGFFAISREMSYTKNSTKSTYLSYTNNELLPLMDSPDTFFSKKLFKSIKYFNKSWIFTSKLIPWAVGYRKFFHWFNHLIINSNNYFINSTHYTPFPRLIAKNPEFIPRVLVFFFCLPEPITRVLVIFCPS